VRGSSEPTTAVTAWIRGENCELDRDSTAGMLTLASHLAPHAGLRRRCQIDLDVSLPAGAELTLDTGSGNVEVAHIEGAVEVDTGSGNVDLTDLVGDLRIETGSGNIVAHELASGNAYAHAGSGNVTLTFTTSPDAVAIETGSGNVHLALPAAHYDLHTDHGSGNQRVSGIVSDADAGRWISIDTGSGNIEVIGR
jgi:DUF4097 and DUF4098 domain-containing protein YvlB